jgi:hypothetical protein
MLHVIPALVEHDTTIPSTLGYDNHPERVPLVTWRDVDTSSFTDPETWKREAIVSTDCRWFPPHVAHSIAKTIFPFLIDHTNEEPRVALALIHAPHRPERKPLLARLEHELGLHRDEHGYAPLAMQTLDDSPGASSLPIPTFVAGYLEDTVAKHWVWQDATLGFFERVAEQSQITHALTLQDDVTVSPDFWPWLAALLKGRPNDVICLDCAHPAARQVFVDGKPGYTSADCMVGIGHVLPIEIAKDFRRWRRDEVKRDFLEWQSEDTLIAFYCMAHQRRIFCPVPCPIDHDLEVASTNGYDGHLYRRPQVTWKDVDRRYELEAWGAKMLDPEWWAQPVAHVGRFYENAHRLFPMALRDAELAQWLVERYEWDCEKTPAKFRRFFTRVSATT